MVFFCDWGTAVAAGSSFSCAGVRTGSQEELICKDAGLAALDLNMAAVYMEASAWVVNEQPSVLKAQQHGWIKGCDDCGKTEDQRSCLERSCRLRIAELQARYGLIQGTAPVVYSCGPGPASQVKATFFPTDPLTLLASRGDQVSLMYQRPSASGARYQGSNYSLWEHQGQVLITWGDGESALRCSIEQKDER